MIPLAAGGYRRIGFDVIDVDPQVDARSVGSSPGFSDIGQRDESTQPGDRHGLEVVACMQGRPPGAEFRSRVRLRSAGTT